MYLLFEDLKDFLMLLETEEDKENVPIFVDKNQLQSDTGMLIGEIIIQYQYDTNMLAVFKTREGIDPVMLPDPQFFSALEYYADKATVEKVKQNSQAMIEKLNASLEIEFEKAKQVLTDKGFGSIIPYTWSE